MSYELSENIKLTLNDGDVIFPTTMLGHFRLITQTDGHNVLGAGEHNVTEENMIDGVLNSALATRWRSKTNLKRKTPNHFSINSPSVAEVQVKVGNVWVKYS